jgi:hypothetical protein
MGQLNKRLNRIVDKINPVQKIYILTGESREVVEKKYQKYLDTGVNPNAHFIFFIAPAIVKPK